VIFSLATFNVGLLEIFGGLYRPVPFVEQRIRDLPKALLNLGTDVIALQEIYTEAHRTDLSSAVGHVYPFRAPTRRTHVFGIENGLLTLSKITMSYDLELFQCATSRAPGADRASPRCKEGRGRIRGRLFLQDFLNIQGCT
jgi:hypothetical protein